MEITATEINNDKQNIDEIVKKSVIAYNKKKIAKRKREIERAEDRKLSKEEINQLAIEIIKSEDSKEYEKNERLVVESEKNRLNDFRNQIQSLNDLTLESAEMEESGLQVSSDFPTYNDLIFKSRANNKLFEKYEKLKQTYFKQVLLSKNAEFYSDIEDFENEDYMMKCLQIIYDMQDMYNIDEKTEDYSIFERFGYDTNIDLSYRLADYIIKNILFTENNNIQNIANYIINQNKVESEKKKQLAEDRIINNELLVKLLSKDFITNNKVCLLENSYINNLSLKKLYRTRTLGELLLEIINPENASTEKALRHQFYCTYEPIRPTKEHYYAWNGLQVFDIDLKEWEGSVDNLKKLLYQELIPFHWFLWIVKSSSGKGLHIYTKVAPPHHIYTKPQDNEAISKYWYYVNYITKQSNINDAIQRLATFNKIAKYPNWNKELDCEYLDNTTARITTGVKLSYDPLPLVNQNFIDLHPALGLSQTLDGLEYETTILRVLLRDNKFNRFITLINDELRQKANENIEKVNLDDVDLSKYVKTNIDLSGLTILPRNQINYFTRYNVCNTLAPLFGKDGLQIAHVILDSKKCKNESEINGFYACAITNKKQPSKVGLEILTKCGVLKQNIAPEILQPMYNSEKAYLRDCMLTAIRCEDEYEYEYKLEDGKYLGDYFDEILSRITHEKINILDVPAGAGKSEFAKKLAKLGKRVLLVLPYISVIKNKVENDETIINDFDVFYGNKSIKDMEYGINAVTTFDKFSKANVDKISNMFDYIFIDESHLLFTSQYRIEATSSALKKIKELYYISSTNQFASKLVLMSGTLTGEEFFFKNVGNFISVYKKPHNKTMEFLLCDDNLDGMTRLASKTKQLIEAGYRLLIPTNKGEIYTEKLIGMIEYLMGRTIKYGYYKRSNTDQEICKLINEKATIADYEVVFCTNYLSVGVDIKDKFEFASIYLGKFSGYEIEQFNARIRKKGIYSIYCITIDENENDLLKEPDLSIQITDDDKLRFIDDKEIANAKNTFVTEYDPVLGNVSTPGFTLFNGKIQFNPEEYELINFEDKYLEAMQHPTKIARVLYKYGYEIKISTEFEGLSQKEQDELKKIGLDSAKAEKIRKHNLMIGTFIDLINKNKYVNEYGLEFNNIIDWISKNLSDTELIVEDRTITDYIQISFDTFATPKLCIVQSRIALEKMIRFAKFLVKKYSLDRCIQLIMQYVNEDGILQQKKFSRAIQLIKLIESSENAQLSEPIIKIIEDIYVFLDQFELDKNKRIPYDTYKSTIEKWTYDYIESIGVKINTKYAFDKIKDSIIDLLSNIAEKSTSKNGISFNYILLPEQNNQELINKQTIDVMITNMFNVTQKLHTTRGISKYKHTKKLKDQEF